ncbi:MAG: FAD:protein FMN transferase [Chitinophagia bacterium]|jgi:thiamine biosynthesis lipoprotein
MSYRFLIVLIFLISVCHLSGITQLQRFHFEREKMGSPFHLIFYHPSATSAAEIGEKCFQLVDSLNHIFSDYDTTSELSTINRTAFLHPVLVSPLMQEILCISNQAYYNSNGVFDIGVGNLTHLWRAARKKNRVPDTSSIKNALLQSGWKNIVYSCEAGAISFNKPNLSLDLGGIAKGFVAQQVINRLQQFGIQHALADAGGDIVAIGSPPNKKGWQIAINRPEEKEALLERNIGLLNQSIATSGDSFQFLEKNGVRYSHIIDPKNGIGNTQQKNVTVIANNGALADWLATACSILDNKAALKLAKKYGAELLITQLIGGKIEYVQTPEFWK